MTRYAHRLSFGDAQGQRIDPTFLARDFFCKARNEVCIDHASLGTTYKIANARDCPPDEFFPKQDLEVSTRRGPRPYVQHVQASATRRTRSARPLVRLAFDPGTWVTKKGRCTQVRSRLGKPARSPVLERTIWTGATKTI